MCTALSFEHYFGRNMDLPYSFSQTPLLISKNTRFYNRVSNSFHKTERTVLGMGTVIDGHPVFAEALNENGLGCAGLNFSGYAYFEPVPVLNKINLAPYDFILWVLSCFETVDQVANAVSGIELVNIPINNTTPVPTLHWMAADKFGNSIVIEKTIDGLAVYNNPVGVMTNSPCFNWHLTNLNEYIKLSPTQPKNTVWTAQPLHALGIGAGTLGMPGDFSSVSRFVRMAYLREYSPEDCSPAQFFHILDNAAMVKGSIITDEGTFEQTIYSSCMDLKNMIYYYKTCENNRISAIKLNPSSHCKNIQRYPYLNMQDIRFQN